MSGTYAWRDVASPVAVLAWGGQHAQMLVGYYGLKGDPFARNAQGEYTNAFSVTGLYQLPLGFGVSASRGGTGLG